MTVRVPLRLSRAEGGGREIDRGIIESCRQGDRDAFRRLYDGCKDRVYGVALHFFHGDVATAEDITQEVFLRLFRTIGQYRHEAAFTTWLYRLVVNVCVDEQRRRRRFLPLDPSQEVAAAMPEEAIEVVARRHEVRDAVTRALAGLKPEFRIAVLLKYYDDLSYEEIAQALGCSPGTVASRLHRGLKALGRALAHLEPATEEE